MNWPSSVVSLQHRNFRLLWIGLLLSFSGSFMQNAALLWHVSLLVSPEKKALALGFVAAGSAARRRARAPLQYRDRRKQTKEQSRGFAVGGLLMTAATWLMKNQFGGPAGLARFVVSKVRKNENRGAPPRLRTGV